MSKINITKFKKACEDSGGIKTTIAKRLGITRRWLYLWLEKHPEMEKLIEEESEIVLDMAENKLVEIKAKTKLKEQQIAGEVSWEASAVDQMKGSWKDELILICLLTPAVLVFVPGMTPHIEAGFLALHKLPDYYKHLLYLACSVSFGVKMGPAAMGLFKKKK